MDTTPLRAAYDEFLETAGSRTFAASCDGGWNAGQVLAHVVIGDRDFASVCAELLSGRTPGYDNRASQTIAYMDTVQRCAGSWQTLMHSVRRGGEELIELLALLNDEQAARVIVCSGIMDDRVIELHMAAGEFAGALATVHLPSHRQQLLNLAATPVQEPVSSLRR